MYKNNYQQKKCIYPRPSSPYLRGHLHSTSNHYHRWKHVHNLCILDSEIPPKTNLFSFDYPRSRRFTCGDYRANSRYITNYDGWLRSTKAKPIISLRGIRPPIIKYLCLLSGAYLLGTSFRRLMANPPSHRKQWSLHQKHPCCVDNWTVFLCFNSTLLPLPRGEKEIRFRVY